MDSKKIEQAVKLFLEGIDEDPNRAGLVDTPGRVVRMCKEIFGGSEREAELVLITLGEEKHDEIILLRDIPLCSFCEHHLLPL